MNLIVYGPPPKSGGGGGERKEEGGFASPPRPAPAPYGGTRKIEIGTESKSLNQFGLFARCSRSVLST